MGAGVTETSISRVIPGMTRAVILDTSNPETIRHLEVIYSLGNSAVNSA